MTDSTEVEPTEEELLAAAEKQALREHATSLGIEFSGNIGNAKLAEKIKAKQEELDAAEEKDTPEAVVEEAPVKALTEQQKTRMARRKKRDEQMALQRIRIANMDPNKSQWEAAPFTFRNRLVGAVKEVVPFNRNWHVPRVILEQIKAKQFQQFYTERDPRTGQEVTRGRLVKEYAIEYLDDLTADELKELERKQSMANA